jgi:hypothetical protein
MPDNQIKSTVLGTGREIKMLLRGEGVQNRQTIQDSPITFERLGAFVIDRYPVDWGGFGWSDNVIHWMSGIFDIEGISVRVVLFTIDNRQK